MPTFYDGGVNVAKQFLTALDPDPARVWHPRVRLAGRNGPDTKMDGGTADAVVSRLSTRGDMRDVYVVTHPGGDLDKDIKSYAHLMIDLDSKDFLPDGVMWAMPKSGKLKAGERVATDAEREAARAEAKAAALYAICGSRDGKLVDSWPMASISVRSGNGHHVYFLLDKPEPMGDGQKYRRAMQALADKLHGDRSICNASRVMRLPGSCNWKSVDEYKIADQPTPVETVFCEPSRRYALDDLLARLGVEVEGATNTVADSSTLPPTAPVGDDWAVKQRPYTPAAVAEIKEALAFLDPASQDSGDHDRAVWLNCLMALKSLVAPPHNWPEHGYTDARGVEVEGVRDLALEWSSRGAKFDEAEFQKAWSSLAPARKVGASIRLETLFKKAYAAGWNPNAEASDDCPRDGSDEGFCCRFLQFVDGKIMFCNGRWHNWTGVFWRPDAGGVWARMKAFALHHVKRANDAFAKAVEQAQSARNDRDAKAILIAAKLALRAAEGILEQPRQKRVLEAAQTPCRIDADRLDADPMLLCCQNGVVDLRTGALLPSDPSALMTKVAACAYDPAACAPRFERFLEEVQPDVEVRSYLQRWSGYCTTGSVQEQAMAIWTGAGSNGKSLLQTLLASALGSYADSSEAKLLVGRERREEGAEPGLAKLRGLRFTYANESDEHSKLSSARIKMLCSCDPIAPRTLHREPITFVPSAKVVLSTNHLPKVDDMSNGVWRRIQAVPFTQTFVDADSAAGHAPGALIKDLGLEAKLKAELPGVLAWIVQGALLWSVLGLEPPPAVRKATATYRADNDSLGACRTFDFKHGFDENLSRFDALQIDRCLQKSLSTSFIAL